MPEPTLQQLIDIYRTTLKEWVLATVHMSKEKEEDLHERLTELEPRLLSKLEGHPEHAEAIDLLINARKRPFAPRAPQQITKKAPAEPLTLRIYRQFKT